MDPMSRKMFKSRDARNTLRGMGGIMASSPELSQTVQQFQEGGAVHAPSGMPYADMSRMQLQALANTGDAIALNVLRGEVPVAAQPDASSIQRFPPDSADLRDDAKADIAGGAVHAPSGMPYADMSRMQLQALANNGDAIALNMLREEVPVAAQPDASSIQRFPPAPADLRDDAKAERMAAESSVLGEFATDIAEGETPVLTPTADTGAGTAAPEIDFDASYAQAKERLGAIMGDEADDDKKNKAMANLAMIGLAIASGKSPNALTNIAQGALAGMQGISKAEAAEKAQEREIELAATKMAADEVDLNKRLASAEKIAAMRTAGGSGTFSPQDRLYNSVFIEMLQETGDVAEASAAALQAAPGASQAAMSAVAGQIVEQNGIRYQRQADGSFKQLR